MSDEPVLTKRQREILLTFCDTGYRHPAVKLRFTEVFVRLEYVRLNRRSWIWEFTPNAKQHAKRIRSKQRRKGALKVKHA
jgi:hypothetical protein